MIPRFIAPDEAATELRDQSASCRRLAGRARSAAGSRALIEVADYFEADARRMDRLADRQC
ncbi:MAG TPA: hypothetical protein VGD23_10355 [Sphingomicrobium sp.]